MKIEKVNIHTLISPDYNPRQITDDAMESLKTSLDEFGYIDPLIVNKVNNHVVGGNQRLHALKELGYSEVDVIFINEPDLVREKAINVRLNNSSGEWDTDKLDNVFKDLELTGFDITLTGFETDSLQPFNVGSENNIASSETIAPDLNTGLKPESNTTNNTPEPTTKEPEKDTYAGGLTDDDVTVKVGDVYILGNHHLMCGDSSIKENIDILIDKDKIDLILTDPPYGINIVNTNGKIEGGANQSQSEPLEPPVNSDSRERACDWKSGRPRRCTSKTV